MTTTRPLVTVLTPVYNGEAYLAQCIESVRAQTYDHWEYVIVNNASRDRTGEIVGRYAALDRRIRVFTNEQLVPVIQNHNIALRHIAPASQWCKFVSADDLLLPECLERMVALGEAHPSVGLISAYQLHGAQVGLAGLPYPSPVVPGRAVARESLLGLVRVFGNPTSHMIRADFVRCRDSFYDESNIHADEAACYEVLRTSDLGFVHQVLTYSRSHPGSVTFTVARRLNTYLPAHIKMLKTYGPIYLTPVEFDHVLKLRMDAYYTFLARVLFTSARRENWEYHRNALRELGFPLSRGRVARSLLRQLGQVLASPGTELPKVFRLIRPRRDDESGWRYWWAPTGFEAARSDRDVTP